jgi:hypothetical protein
MEVRRSGDGIMMAARLIPFGKYAMATVTPDHLYVASGDRWELRGFGADGGLERIVRLDRVPIPVTGDMVEAYIQEELYEATDPAEAREIRQGLEEMPIPDALPAFGGVHAGRLGFLFVERYRIPGQEAPVFDILDTQGRLVGWVGLPPLVEVLEIGEDYVLALDRDELEVEYVRLFPLTRPGG